MTHTYKCPKCGQVYEIHTDYIDVDGVPICYECNVVMEEQ